MIDYRLEPADLHAHQFRVSVTIDRPAAEQRLSMPVWIPGSYLVREFARHLSGLDARQGTRALPVQQTGKASWTVACSGSEPLTVSYTVYAFDTSVRAAYLDAERGFFNGTSVFLRAEGRTDEPQRLAIAGLPDGWQIATTLPSAGSGFVAEDYDALVDHPVELGRFWRGTFEACGVAHEFVVAGALPGFDGERLLADTRTICEAQIRFWHPNGTPPFDRYLFLLNATDDGYGGLEHRASTALIASRRDLPRVGQAAGQRAGHAATTDGYATLLGLISHEYFHTWNVKRMRPREFARYDYTTENHTELLWFFEGFTSYYDDLALVRSGLIEPARYLKLLAKTINNVLGTPGRHVQSVADASFDAWTKYYRQDENTVNATVSYYTLGSLVALALDLSLRQHGQGSLDDVMRGLWAKSQGGPIGEDDIAVVLEQVAGRSYTAELAAWVHGRGEPPLQGLLAAVGIGWSEDAPTLAQRLGARLSDSGGTLKLQAVLRGGTAEQAGLAAGDELIALDGWRLKRTDDLTALQAFERELPLLAARDQRVLHLRLPALTAASQPRGAVTLAPDAQADAAALARRQAWLGQP